LYYVPPVGSRWWNYTGQIYRDEARPRYVRRTERNIPDGAVALKEGTQVISADGERVGDVEEIFVDEEDDSITHLLISRGFLFKEERFVPVSWIDGIWEDVVHLSVESTLLSELQPYLPLDRPDKRDLTRL
jgi:sporulation protein YlmC with PRC-barrel domain